MRTIIQYLSLTLAAAFIITSSFAQNTETVTIPLTNPNSPGHLELRINHGSVNIEGYNGKEVVIKANAREHNHTPKKQTTKNGMKRISSGGSIKFTTKENDNKVSVSAWPTNPVDFNIQVPTNFSLTLSLVNAGDLFVKNVNGEFEVSNVNGKITMENVSGSLLADALNQTIEVSFKTITPNKPMAFTSLNGDLDISFPPTLKASVKAKSDNGSIYTDFDLKTTQKTESKNERTKDGVYKVTIDKWTTGTINGGGPEFLFKTLNGDILIRDTSDN